MPVQNIALYTQKFLINHAGVVRPARLDTATHGLVILELLCILREPRGCPKHSPIGIHQFPRPTGPFKVPFVDRIVSATAPTNPIGEACAHHRIEDHIRHTTGPLAAL